jgi:hypothetical protein
LHVHYTVIKEDTNEYIEPMKYLLTVPKYVQALKTARGRAALEAKKLQLEHIEAKATDSDDVDLPEVKKPAKAPPPKPTED